jgi:hypothetical protein
MNIIQDPLTENQMVTLSKKARIRAPRKNLPKIHPILEIFATYQNDEWWREKLLEIAKGKCKGKIMVKPHEVTVKKGAKTKETFVFDEDVENEVMAFRFVEFLKLNCLIYSPSDKEKLDLVEEEEIPTEWGKLKKDQKEICIANFIDDEKQKNGLSRRETDELYHLLCVFINSGRLAKTDFILDRGRLSRITSLDYDPKARQYYTKNEQPKLKTKTTKKKVEKTSIHSQQWKKYIDNLNKTNDKRLRKKKVEKSETEQTEMTEGTETDYTQA